MLWGPDYDGGHKAWIRWAEDGADDIVPGSPGPARWPMIHFTVAVSAGRLHGRSRPAPPRSRSADGGEELHDWRFDKSLQTPEDAAIDAEHGQGIGAGIMGRNMFASGRGEWDLDWNGWWGPNPPYGFPVFVLTHYPRESVEMEGGTTFHFVTEGFDEALEQGARRRGRRRHPDPRRRRHDQPGARRRRGRPLPAASQAERARRGRRAAVRRARALQARARRRVTARDAHRLHRLNLEQRRRARAAGRQPGGDADARAAACTQPSSTTRRAAAAISSSVTS